jgi:hypothetical protein
VEMSEGDGGGDDGEKPVAPTSPPNVVSKAVRMIRLRKPRPESLTLSTVSGCVGACVCVCVCGVWTPLLYSFPMATSLILSYPRQAAPHTHSLVHTRALLQRYLSSSIAATLGVASLSHPLTPGLFGSNTFVAGVVHVGCRHQRTAQEDVSRGSGHSDRAGLSLDERDVSTPRTPLVDTRVLCTIFISLSE